MIAAVEKIVFSLINLFILSPWPVGYVAAVPFRGCSCKVLLSLAFRVLRSNAPLRQYRPPHYGPPEGEG